MPVVGADVPPKTANELERYRRQRHINKSEAIRRLLRTGLENERGVEL